MANPGTIFLNDVVYDRKTGVRGVVKERDSSVRYRTGVTFTVEWEGGAVTKVKAAELRKTPLGTKRVGFGDNQFSGRKG